MTENTMRQIKIEKITLNIGCGDDKEKIERAQKLLEKLTESKPIVTKSKKRSTFGIVKGKPLGVKVTLRKQKAREFLKKALESVDKKLKSSQFDNDGNFSFGIKEYIDIPGVRYAHDIGMLGLNVTVTLERPGFRIKRRRIQTTNIPKKHNINKEEATNWIKNNFGVEII